jgi:serine/threonine protein kinase
MIGKTISHYQILEKLGEGGMGVVYKARDTHLDRLVALKILPAEKVADPDRRLRFVQEAKAASALNHPHIVTIHDIDLADGVHFIAMEYVDGKTLDQLIPRHGMRLNEALKVAVQMADALAAAHEAGIVHRDLKPGNLMVTEKGQVKVLDFGLAKLTEKLPTGAEDATLTAKPDTEEGKIVGTVAYMSPEQAEGKKVDARSDIFSLGSVLYEMMTGEKAFQGSSKISTLSAILHREPNPVSAVAKAIPADLEKLIGRCLRKDPERRIQHMDDVKLALLELKEESDSGTLAGAQAALRPARRTWVWAGAALVVVTIVVAAWLFRGTAKKPQATVEVVPLTSFAGFEKSPSFSLDGNQVAFSWNGEKQDNFDIYVKLIGSPTPLRLTTDPAADVSPAFSPDGRSIGFVRVLKDRASFIVIPAIGGLEHLVADVVPAPNPYLVGHSFAWLPDGKWAVIDGLALLSTETGETRSLTSPPKSSTDYSPAVSPDGRTVAFSRSVSIGRSDIYLLNLTEDFKPKGEPRRLTFLNGDSVDSVWTANGREIIFSSGVFGSEFKLWKVPASGAVAPEQLQISDRGVVCPTVSRSDKRLAYERSVFDANIWRLLLCAPGGASGLPVQLIASTRSEYEPQYSPDGKRIAFTSERSGVPSIWVSDADGSKAEELFSRAGTACGNPRWSPDGQRIAFDSIHEGNSDIYVIRASGGKPIPLTNDSADDIEPSWSGDGKWVYFVSIRTGRYEVWKVPAGGGEAVQVTRNGGFTAFESPDGESVYYTKAWFSSGLWRMPVSGGEESQVLPSVVMRAFSLVNDGIYFIPEPASGVELSIQFLSFATAKVKTIAPMSGFPSVGLSVSPDGRSLLFSQYDEGGGDLMLVENFR